MQDSTQTVVRSVEISPGIVLSLVVPKDHPINTIETLNTGEDLLLALIELATVGMTICDGLELTKRLQMLYDKYRLTPVQGAQDLPLRVVVHEGNPLNSG